MQPETYSFKAQCLLRVTRLNTKQSVFDPHGLCTVHIPSDYVKKLNFPVLQLLIRNYKGEKAFSVRSELSPYVQ